MSGTDTTLRECPKCEGNGETLKDTAQDDGHIWRVTDFEPCSLCKGTGKVNDLQYADWFFRDLPKKKFGGGVGNE